MRVCLAIASFRHDDQVGRILEAVAATAADLFATIIVVDSLGSGNFPELIRKRGWKNVAYHCAPTNLGSAGNLAWRLQLAAATGCDWVYALNHDGEFEASTVKALLDAAARLEQPGAVYPLHYRINREEYDVTGTRALPLGFRGSRVAPTEPQLLVHWGSSNGALYALEPVRRGLLPWAELWMGWEDLEFGWTLETHGYRQIMVPRARFTDHYEYAARQVSGQTLWIGDKPNWYIYYRIRNLILIMNRHHRLLAGGLVVMHRALLEMLLTLLFRHSKLACLGLLARGIGHGILCRSGKGEYP